MTPPKLWNILTPEEEDILVRKKTEPANTGELLHNEEKGTYVCRRCNAKLYASTMKFPSHCGWPSFDDAYPNAVVESEDRDGYRTEITCASCGGHLGHIFRGENYTPKNTRHCVNSLSMKFIPK